MHRRLFTLAIVAALPAIAEAQTTVTTIAPSTNTTPKVWYNSTVTSGGQTGISELTGVGGDLETNLPLGVGAVRLTTKTDNNDRANIGVLDDYGKPDDVFSTLSITYSWHKGSNGTQNLTAAPSLKLAFFGQPGCAGDCFGQLIYEPNWNGVGATSPNGPSSAPALDTWTTVTIDENNGLFWWTGGFGIGGSGGGPPVRTLAEWRTLLSPDFGQSAFFQVEVGVGSFNQNQLGYFDNVIIAHDFGAGYTAAYDFEPEFTSASVAVGTAPCDVIATDLTGDGVADIATADNGSDTVTIRINDGTGGFGTSSIVALAALSGPSALAAGDLFVGGGTDIAVTARDGDAVILIDNSPAGTFAVASTLSTLPATEPVGIAVGDIDGSGTDDLVVAMQGDLLVPGNGGVSYSLNGGALVSLPAPVGGFLRPQNVLLCDLDSDGDQDAVVTMMGTAFAPTLLDNILLFENVGGVFNAPIALSVSQNPRGVCCLDIDEDGDADLAVTAESFPTILPGSIEVFENLGLTAGGWTTAAFTSGGSFSGGTSPIDLACGDLRDDSIPGFCALYDVVAVNFGSENVTHFAGYTAVSDTFGGQSNLTAGAVPAAVAIADFDGDKTPDMVIANKASNNVTIKTAYAAALAKPFGSGCAGTGALVPQISAVGSPTFLNPSFGVKVTNARPFAPALFGVSLNQFTTTLGGCELYLLPPLVLLGTVTSAAGETTVTLPIPGALAGVAGCDVFFQYFIFDPNGSYNGQFAFSDALRIKIGG